jgi:hypothetical protein
MDSQWAKIQSSKTSRQPVPLPRIYLKKVTPAGDVSFGICNIGRGLLQPCSYEVQLFHEFVVLNAPAEGMKIERGKV